MVDLFNDDEPSENDNLFWDDDPDAAAVAPSSVDNPVDDGPITLIGHQAIELRLVDLINQNKLPHGLMFVGPRGVGKFQMAMRLARTLLTHVDNVVDNGPGLFGDAAEPALTLRNLDVSPDHMAVKLMDSGAHPDFLVIGADTPDDTKAKAISVDDIRRVPAFLRMRASMENGWRVVIIDNADTMNRNAQNALLKILEEPPVRVAIILVVHQMGTLAPTIRSRCQMVTFHALQTADFDAALKTMGVRLDAADMKWARALSGNAPGQVAQLVDHDGFTLIHDFIHLWTEWPRVDETAWTAFTEKLGGTGADDQTFRLLLRVWSWMAHACLRAKNDPQFRAQINTLLSPMPVDKIVDHFTLAGWIEICDTLDTLFARAIAAALERRQVLYSARTIMLPI